MGIFASGPATRTLAPPAGKVRKKEQKVKGVNGERVKGEGTKG
jgi:hypothetical protein